MKRLLGVTLAVVLLGVGVTGCGGTCSTYCDYMTQCGPDLVEDMGGNLIDCTWDDPEEDVLDECELACEEAYDRQSDGEAEQVDLCIDCVDTELEGSCSGDDYSDALDRCDSECDDDDVGDWQDDLWDDWEPGQSMDCGV